MRTPFDNIAIIRANQQLAPFNAPCPENSGMAQYALQSLLAEFDSYEMVLIDCPPNLYQCSWNAMLAADFVLIPVPPEDFGAQGLRVVHQAVEHAGRGGPEARTAGAYRRRGSAGRWHSSSFPTTSRNRWIPAGYPPVPPAKSRGWRMKKPAVNWPTKPSPEA